MISCIDIQIHVFIGEAGFSTNGGDWKKSDGKSCEKYTIWLLVSSYFDHKLELNCSKRDHMDHP
jgi:hypothetical protein